MIFESLSESAEHHELILIDGGLLRYHRRRDGVVTIREVLVLPERRGEGIGTRMLEELKQRVGPAPIVAACPADLWANDWYASRGFRPAGTTQARSGREVRRWRLDLS